jgi:hypothetical protein
MERERFSGAERKRGMIFVVYDLWNILGNLCSLLHLEKGKCNQNGQMSLVTAGRRTQIEIVIFWCSVNYSSTRIFYVWKISKKNQ